MFTEIYKTAYPPTTKPILIWDGECGFCKFWKIRIQLLTDDNMDFAPYQEASQDFPDIPEARFKEASRLIDTNGKVYSGPDSLYMSLSFTKSKNLYWHKLYIRNSVFKYLSDIGYEGVTKNRSLLYQITTSMFGKDPTNLKYYWLVYVLTIFIIIMII